MESRRNWNWQAQRRLFCWYDERVTTTEPSSRYHFLSRDKLFCKGKDMLQVWPSNERDRAQVLVYEAMDIHVHDKQKAYEMCLSALELDRDCTDALTMLSERERTPMSRAKMLRSAIESGRQELGPNYFKSEVGNFWGIVETRPYMRALHQYALCLLGSGSAASLDEAIETLEDMLRLNPRDNQGARLSLIGAYLTGKRYRCAKRLLQRYDDRDQAVWNWSRALLAHVLITRDRASKALHRAIRCNPHVVQYFLPATEMPPGEGSFDAHGKPSEARMCANVLWSAWKAHPRTRKWLESEFDGLSLPL